jgi:D-3-phosphoglycerate dehydrogenase / 2-oxoglutarate reductase
MATPIYIIDFDSTFTKVEALDELANISLQGHSNQQNIEYQIADITTKGMIGEMDFRETLVQRLALLNATKMHVHALIKKLHDLVTDSFKRNKAFLQNTAPQIYIVSGGFTEYIAPIVAEYGITEDHVYANTFVYDDDDKIIGFDEKNVLSQANGKVKLLQQLQLQGDICIIGDGFTDYQLKKEGLAQTFYLFTENVRRENLVEYADEVINSLDEILYLNQLSRSQSFPKTKIKVLLLENVHPNALHFFQSENLQIESINGALDEDELCEKIKEVHLLGIRSKTMVTKKVLQHANKLMSIGAFCIGTNQIDLKEAANKGIVVFNAPYSNTRSVVELAIGEMIMLMRNVVTKSNLLHQGIWDKSAKNSFEIRGKIIGIVGYGNIGTQLSVLAEALGMQVIFYDIVDKLSLGNARKCNSLEELLSKADIVSMHVDGRESNHHIIGAAQLDVMKNNVIFMNLSRGHVVDLDALQTAIANGKVWGASVDVFPEEPKTNDEVFKNKLQQLPNTILTPHIGGSTEEAQANIGEYVPYKMMNYVNKGDTYGAVNFPEVQLPSFANSHRLLHIHQNIPGVLAKLNAVFAKYQVNIQAQFLKTNEEMGYVITDVDTNYNADIVKEIKEINGTVKFRMLY